MVGQRRSQAAFCFAFLLAFGGTFGAAAEEAPPPGFDRTPPRLGLVDGPVSFWRSGAPDWVSAQMNTALAAGDRLATGSGGNLELQIGPRAFVRAGSETQLGLDSLEPDFLQFRVTSGTASLDLRSLPTGETVELDTPNAAFTVEHPGYYRVEVRDETTTFASRRGGRATVTSAGSQSSAIGPSEEVVVTGSEAPQVETYSAPELDAWDRWNYERTDHQIDAVSARYVPPDVYGVDDLDHDGDWRVVPQYGAVWVPGGVGPGWAPYTTGSWMYDPYYGWTWVDTAPWGWAPYHYGRWVHVGGYWGWAPGPIVVRPYYAPALVAFYGAPGFSVGIHVGVGFGFPAVGWVALGWGEPIVPWWGPRGCVGVAHWAGWGGPRVVNNVTINKTTIVNVNNITNYQNAAVPGAVVAVKPDRFGQGPVAAARLAQVPVQQLHPVHGELGVKPAAASLVGGANRVAAPPQGPITKTVVATHAPQITAPVLEVRRTGQAPAAERKSSAGAAPSTAAAAPVRIVTPPERGPSSAPLTRAPFGQNGSAERVHEPPPPHFQDIRTQGSTPRAESAPITSPRPAPSHAESAGSVTRAAPVAPHANVPAPSRESAISAPRAAPVAPHANAPAPSFQRAASQPTATHHELPGEPASRVYQRTAETPRSVAPAPAPPVHMATPPSGPTHGGGAPSGPAHGGGGSHPGGKDKHQ